MHRIGLWLAYDLGRKLELFEFDLVLLFYQVDHFYAGVIIKEGKRIAPLME